MNNWRFHMSNREITAKFNFSYSTLIKIVKEKLQFVLRDIVKFNEFGIVEENINETKQKNEDLENTPTDNELIGVQTIATEVKTARREEVVEKIQKIMRRVKNCFGIGSAIYNRFGTRDLSKMNDAKLLMCAKQVIRVSRLYLSELSLEGLTEEIIVDLATSREVFDKACETQSNAIAERDIVTESRMISANAIYDNLVKYCNTGKDIWKDDNLAKYNDYILYDTPTSTSVEPETPGIPT